MSNTYDLVVIGSGPGGYVAAIRAAQLGMKVACVEKEKSAGGTCLNIGCIPSKALLESSHHFHAAQEEFSQHGIEMNGITLKLDQMMNRKDQVVKRLTQGVKYLFKKNKIDLFEGFARFKKDKTIEVDSRSSKDLKEISAKNFLIATGSVPSSLPGIEIDEDRVVSSTGALSLDAVPKSLTVIGGGYIGLELGSVWNRLGSQVQVLEYAPRILPGMDEGLAKGLFQILKKQGMSFELESKVQEVKSSKNASQVSYEKGGESKSIQSERVLMSVGRKPYTEGLNLEKINLKVDSHGFLKVDENYQTEVDGVYAVGDVIGGKMLAHKAEEEGVACVEAISGRKPAISYPLVPMILYTFPEVGSVGLTEQESEEKGIEFKKSEFPLKANGRALSMGATEGFVKIIAAKKTDRILGAHILAPNASEMIHEFCVAMEFSAKTEDIALTMHGHPTLSESIKEAALGAGHGFIHI
jgi:dihydrolipoamide dehydrogenase